MAQIINDNKNNAPLLLTPELIALYESAGLKVPGKLLPKRIPGGVLLTDSTYEMR